jgi:proteasome accessory factor B
VRTFRLSRIGDEVTAFGPAGVVHKPADVDLRAIVDRVTGSGAVTGTATVWVAEGRAQELRRLGTTTGERQVAQRSGSVLQIPVRSRDWIARLVAGHGADALVLDPPELRDDVLAKLRDAAGQGARSE